MWVSARSTQGVAGTRTKAIPVALTSLCQKTVLMHFVLKLSSSLASELPPAFTPAFLRACVCIIYSAFSLGCQVGYFSSFSLQPLFSSVCLPPSV